jgi:SAM-dependent methyltransferase
VGGWRTAQFALARHVARALERASRGVLHVAAGALTLEGVRAAVADRWQDFGTGETFIRSGLMPWEQAFYTRMLNAGDEVLVVGSGTGRDLIALVKAGFRAEGLEVAAAAAAIARATLARERLHAPITIGRIEEAATGRPFDAFIFSWFCYSYIPQRAGRIKALRAAAGRLNPGGRILISYLPADAPPHSWPLAITDTVARLTRAGWRSEPGDTLWVGSRGMHYEHLFADGEIDAEARDAGLRVVYHKRGEECVVALERDADHS